MLETIDRIGREIGAVFRHANKFQLKGTQKPSIEDCYHNFPGNNGEKIVYSVAAQLP